MKSYKICVAYSFLDRVCAAVVLLRLLRHVRFLMLFSRDA